jgi:hypothetical protein
MNSELKRITLPRVTKVVLVEDDGRGTAKSYSSTLDLGTLVVYGATPKEVIGGLQAQLAQVLENLFQTDFEKYTVRRSQAPAWIEEDKPSNG